jgi:hypothetical protein
LLVTIPPLQISRSVATHVSQANRFSQPVDLPEFLQFILEKITEWRRFRGWISCSRRPMGDAAQVLFLLQHDASHSEAATVKVSAKRRKRAPCAVVVQDAAKHRRLARPHSEAWARLVAELCPVGLR